MGLTLEQIAELAGVSRSTVSRVVNNQPSVKPQVRERVWDVIRETGYQPNAAARSLVTRRTRIVGVIIPEALTSLFVDPFFPHFLRGVTETCNARHYSMMLSLFDDGTDQDEMYRRVVSGGHLDGVIVASAPMDDPIFPKLLRDGMPFVLVGRLPDEQVNYVDVDNVAASRSAVEYLIELGHCRIGTVSGPLNTTHGQHRLEGYRLALEAHNLAYRPELVVEGDFAEATGYAGTRQLLPASPTAIFAASDPMAIGALRAIREAGLKVPRDISLVGFDDVPIASAVEPALTTVHQPIGQLGARAAELLFDRLDNSVDMPASTQRVILPAHLVVRDSCGPVK